MNSRPLIGIIMLSINICFTYQKPFWNGKVYPEGLFLDHNDRGINMNDNLVNRNGNVNTAPFILIPDSSLHQMNTAENILRGPTNVINKDINSVQPIYRLFEHSKPTNTDLKNNGNIGIMGSASNIQFVPEILLPMFNTYNEQYPGFYELQYPQFNSNYEIIEIPDQSLFLPPEVNYMEPFFYKNFNPYKNQYLSQTNTDVSSSEDETYKVVLKSASHTNVMPEVDLGPVRGFKTNFSGDISKCDMICKCRNVNLKQPAPTQTPSGPYTPRKVLPVITRN